jgi:asparagine synthase (glutamine-hydrolysing)
VASVGVDTALSRLVGQFALAIVDRHTRRAWLVRDRMGQKPLYWTISSNGTLVWGSELRALRPVPELTWRPNPVALQALLLWEYIPSPSTPWADIHKLPPGGRLEFDGTTPRLDRWYVPPVPRSGGGGNHGQWAKSVRGSLQVAVMQRLRADVEVGGLLSGGVDSTLVCALAQGVLPRPLQSFGVSIRSPGFDEGPHARAAAASIGTFHRQVPVEVGELSEIADDVFAHMDEPLADSSLLPTWRLMQAVHQAGLKCVVSGDGADELFGGYPTTLAHRLTPMLRATAPLGRWLLRLRPARQQGVSRDYMARRLLQGLARPFPWRHQVWMGAWLPEELDLDASWDSFLSRTAAESAGTDAASRSLHLDQRLYLADGVLVKVDRASMAHGVEVRSPFLDHRVVELAADIGIDHKVAPPGPLALRRGGVFQGKRVLKTAAATIVPASTVQRPKQGFGAPVGPWLKGVDTSELNAMVESVSDVVSPDLLRAVVAEHLDGRADHRRRLWSCWTLHRWRQTEWSSAPCVASV